MSGVNPTSGSVLGASKTTPSRQAAIPAEAEPVAVEKVSTSAVAESSAASSDTV